MGDDSEGDDEQLFKRQRSTSPLSKSPLAALTENQQQEGNDNAARVDTVSSSDEEMDDDAKKKARVAAYWSKRQAKKSAEEAVWAATVYPVVIVATQSTHAIKPSRIQVIPTLSWNYILTHAMSLEQNASWVILQFIADICRRM